MSDAAGSGDPRVDELREQITANDVRLVEALTNRLELVAQLKRVKEERGIDFLDPDREAWLIQHLTDASSGKLSPEGVREFCLELLALTKRELSRSDAR